MKINLKQLEAFIWVSDLGSFRKAAVRLNTTQPNISARISSLENLLDVQLLERDAGSVRLTTNGRQLLDYARKVLKSTDKFIDAADRAVLFDDVLRLGVTEMVVHTWLRDFLKEFKQLYPNIIVELTVDLSANIEKELHDYSIDLAFQSGPFSWKSSGNKKLGKYPLIWIASSKTDLQSDQTISFDELGKFPILTHARGTAPYKEVESHFSKQQDLHVRLVPSSNLAACIHMAVDGYGVAIVPSAMVINEIKTGELFEVNYGWKPKRLHFSARYHAEKRTSIITKACDIALAVSQTFQV